VQALGLSWGLLAAAFLPVLVVLLSLPARKLTARADVASTAEARLRVLERRGVLTTAGAVAAVIILVLFVVVNENFLSNPDVPEDLQDSIRDQYRASFALLFIGTFFVVSRIYRYIVQRQSQTNAMKMVEALRAERMTSVKVHSDGEIEITLEGSESTSSPEITRQQATPPPRQSLGDVSEREGDSS
jgi:predicted secreted protein